VQLYNCLDWEVDFRHGGWFGGRGGALTHVSFSRIKHLKTEAFPSKKKWFKIGFIFKLRPLFFRRQKQLRRSISYVPALHHLRGTHQCYKASWKIPSVFSLDIVFSAEPDDVQRGK